MACQLRPDAPPFVETRIPAEVPTLEQSAGTLLKGGDGELYRLMEDGRIRHICDRSIYLALGYQEENAITVSEEELASIPLGPPLTRWITSQADPNLYFLKEGIRYRVPNIETMKAIGGSMGDISLVTEEFIEGFELATDPLPTITLAASDIPYPESTAVLWADGFLWTANESGLLTRWDVETQDYKQYRLPNEPIIRALASDGQAIFVGTEGGDIWQLADDDTQARIVEGESGWVSALAFRNDQGLWYADASHFDPNDLRYHLGRGLSFLDREEREEEVHQPVNEQQADSDALGAVTALAFDPENNILWAGTRFAGLLQYTVEQDSWETHTTFNSDLGDNTINDLKLAPDGSLWLATGSGFSNLRGEVWENYHLAEDPTAKGALSLAVGEDNIVWAAAESYITVKKPGEGPQVYSVVDNPLLAERVRFVVLDDQNLPWFIGRRGKIHFDGDSWIAYDADVRHFAAFTPVEPPTGLAPPRLNFPSPTEDYLGWLATWPRPEADNGRCIHFLQAHQYDVIEAQRQVNRLKDLGIRWTLVHYAGHDQLVRIAPIFQEAGITVVWRPFVRPYERYASWTEDVEYLRSRGLPPYMQLYNEPSLVQEWENIQPVDQETYLRNMWSAAQEVYDAAGYIGLQLVDPDWLRLTLQTIKAQGEGDIFDRLFFVAHLYGLNHPPEYDEDINSVLGFREYAQIFEKEIGFVPAMIAGEGGWRPGEAQDNRYPVVSDRLHRDYHLAVFDWFRAGQLSNGEELPDYFFAFCPWLISDPHDPAAWYDSDSGDKTLTIEAVEAMPPFEREFSWDR